MDVRTLLKGALAFTQSAEFTTGAAIGMVPIAMALTGHARLKADDILIELEEANDYKPLATGEKVKATWMCYIPPIIAGGLTIFLFLWSHKKQGQKLVALASAYTLTDNAFKQYKSKVEEMVSKKKFDEIDHSINQDMTSQMSLLDGDILATNRGDVLCVDQWTGLKFFSNKAEIKDAVSEFNAEMVGDMYEPLSKLYELIGISPQEHPEVSREEGWNVLADKSITVDFDSTLDKDGVPTLVMIYEPKPRPMYDSL